MSLKRWLQRRRSARPISRKRSEDEGRVTLGGRAFRKIGIATLEHDFRLIGLLREIGLYEPYRLQSESPAEYGTRLLQDLIASGRAFDVLGHLLIPAEVPPENWTPEIARETAGFIGALTRPEDKEEIQALTLGFLLGFFEHGLSSWRLSTTSSESCRSESPTATPATAMASGAP